MGLRVACRRGANPPAAVHGRLARLGILPVDAEEDADFGSLPSSCLERSPEGTLSDGQLEEALRAAEESRADTPAVVLLIPAAGDVAAGPVVVCSPAASATSYELYLAAGIASTSGLPVEHLNARGRSASASDSAAPARGHLKRGVPAWTERLSPDLEQALESLPARPAVIVHAASTLTAEIHSVLQRHPDADQLLIIDLAHHRFGVDVAAQLGAMVELAIDLRRSTTQRTAPNTPDTAASRDAHSDADSDAHTSPAPVHPLGTAARIRASDVIHAGLTDRHLVLTNRTGLHVRVSAALGSALTPDVAAAQIQVDLDPGAAQQIETDRVGALAHLAAPSPVTRTWSHSTSEVYEGGERRLLALDIAVLGDDGTVSAERRYEVPNGLDFAATAGQLRTLVGAASAGAVLPEPARGPVASAWDIIGALEAGMRAAASAMPHIDD
ncbi:hypothetical protein [Pseudoclavibacter helvolus]|uniref:hypothetical protein n=1 Tax=Pseudoclavibacter helvolus TaxID=255205 RepID=UPI003C7216E1